MNQTPSFTTAYKEYSKHYSSKNFKECLNVFAKIDLRGKFKTHEELVKFLLRSVCYVLQQATSPANEHKVAVLNGFKTVLSDITEASDYDKFLLTLGLFSNPKDFDKFVSCFAYIYPYDSDLQSWLKAVNQYSIRVLQQANLRADNANLRKELYVKLTGALLIFARAEKTIASRGKWRFEAALNFLNSCEKLPIFEKGEDVQQYKLCFQLLNDFLLALSSQTENGQLAAKMKTFHEQLRSITKTNQLRATLVKNNFMTLSAIIKSCESRFVELVDSNSASSLLNLLVYIALISSQMKMENPSCSTSCDNIGIHSCHEVTMVATNMYLKLMGKHTIDGAASEKFFGAIITNFECISKLTCTTVNNVNYDANRLFKLIATKSKTKEEANVVIPFVKFMLKRFQKIKSAGITQIAESDLFNHLFNALETIGKLDESIDVGYLMLAFLMNPTNSNLNFDHHAWNVAKKQQKLEASAMKTPYDFFNKASKETLYGVKLPEKFNVQLFSLAYLRIGFKYAVLDTTLAKKIAHQMLMMASSKDAAPLKFAFSIQTMNFDEMSDQRMDRLVRELQPMAKSDMSIAMQIAAIKYLKFNNECKLLFSKYEGMSLNDALTEKHLASDDNIFRQCTLDREKRQIEKMRSIKKAFVQFVEFYVNLKTGTDRKQYEDEKDMMLRELKALGKQFIVRGLMDDGFDVFMALYNLAKAEKDDYGLIDSCSCFAENSVEFKQKYPNVDLNAIIKVCYPIAVKKLKELATLSARRQSSVCVCLLNLVLFYYEDDEDNQSKITLILRFIFGTIGGISDVELQNSTRATIGEVKWPTDPTPKINSLAVRTKFMAVFFTITTKYGAPCNFHPSKFVHFVLEHVKKNLSVYYDDPVLLFNLIPDMTIWLLSTYRSNENAVAILTVLLKLAVRSGYALQSIRLLVAMMNAELMSEKLKACQIKLKALETIMQTVKPSSSDHKNVKKTVYGVDESDKLCEPIRKKAEVTTPMKCLSPSKVISNGISNEIMKYLPKHRSGCECAVCYHPQNQFQAFCVAVCYARYVYISKEFDVRSKRMIFTELYNFWEQKRNDVKKFPRSALFYAVSARMLTNYSHFQAKFEKNFVYAKELLTRGLKGLEKVKHGSELMKRDLKVQCDDMEIKEKQKGMTMEERLAGIVILNRKKDFDVELSTDNLQTKKPTKSTTKAAKPVAKIVSNPRPNLLDMLNDQPPTSSNNFQIHGDGDDVSVTPCVKKTSRGRTKHVEDTPIRTPAASKQSAEPNGRAKALVRPKRLPKIDPKVIDLTDIVTPHVATKATEPKQTRAARKPNLIPTVNIDLTSPPAVQQSDSHKSTEKPLEEIVEKKSAPTKQKGASTRATRK